jgi:integrase
LPNSRSAHSGQITRVRALWGDEGRRHPARGEHGRKRNFHSLRHSFARVALQNGARIDWVQRQLGHSSITLTVDVYGGWERKAEKAEAERLEGAFPMGARTDARTGLSPQGAVRDS